jgi:hypothetical protein
MTTLGIAMLLSVGALTLAVAWLVSRLAAYRRGPETAGEPSAEYCAARYAPMTRLLDAEEEAYLARQPGVDARVLSQFRRQRRRVFRAYLRELAADYSALHAEARQLVAASPEKNAELVEMLLRQQVRFWMRLAAVEVQLVLESAGLGHVNPGRLLETVEGLSGATAVPGPVRVL